MTQTMWVIWITILVSQVGLIYKLTSYLDVTRIFNRLHVLYKDIVLVTDKRVNFGFHEHTEPSLAWNHFTTSSCMWCSEISFLRILYMGPVLYPAKNEEIYGIVWYLIFYKTSARGSQVGHIWVTSGLLCGSVDEVGQQV